MFNEQQITIGFKLIREESDDIVTIERVREMLFWGINDTLIEYNGRKSDQNTNQTLELRFAQAGHIREEEQKREETYKKLMQKLSKNDMPQEIREQFD